VTSLEFLRFLKGKLETPYVVSNLFNRLSGADGLNSWQGRATESVSIFVAADVSPL